MKKIWFLSFVFLLVACTGEDDTQKKLSVEQGQSVPVTSQSNDTANAAQLIEVVEKINAMSQWESFYSTFMYKEYSDVGMNLASESTIKTKYRLNPPEAYIEHLDIGFSQQMVDYYANKIDGNYENHNMNGWRKMEASTDPLMSIIPSRIELLQTLIANAEEFYKMGGEDYPDGGFFNIRADALEEVYLKLLKTFFMNAIENDVDREQLKNLYSDSMEFTMISVTIEQYEDQIGQYTIQVFFINPETGEEQEYHFFEMFEYVNELEKIELPEELQQLLA